MAARKGRPPLPGARTPSGALSRSREANAARVGVHHTRDQPHRREVAEHARGDQRAENMLGRLFLGGTITEPECWAGERYRQLRAEFAVVLATPTMPESAVTRMIAPGVETPAEADYLSGTPESPEDRRRRVLDAWDEAMAALDAWAPWMRPLRPLAVLEAVVLRDEYPNDLRLFRMTLWALAMQFGLKPRRGWSETWAALGEREPDRGVRVVGSRTERPGWGHEERAVRFVREGRGEEGEGE